MHTKEELAVFLGNDKLAESARLLELIGTWASIKILQYLAQIGKAANTAELARELHLDIDDTLRILEELKNYDFVELLVSRDGTKLWNAKIPRRTILDITDTGIKVNLESATEPRAQEVAPPTEEVKKINHVNNRLTRLLVGSIIGISVLVLIDIVIRLFQLRI